MKIINDDGGWEIRGEPRLGNQDLIRYQHREVPVAFDLEFEDGKFAHLPPPGYSIESASWSLPKVAYILDGAASFETSRHVMVTFWVFYAYRNEAGELDDLPSHVPVGWGWSYWNYHEFHAAVDLVR